MTDWTGHLRDLDELRADWRAAREALDLRDTAANWDAEERAWDAFRDACEAANPSDCDHPECPHPEDP